MSARPKHIRLRSQLNYLIEKNCISCVRTKTSFCRRIGLPACTVYHIFGYIKATLIKCTVIIFIRGIVDWKDDFLVFSAS